MQCFPHFNLLYFARQRRKLIFTFVCLRLFHLNQLRWLALIWFCRFNWLKQTFKSRGWLQSLHILNVSYIVFYWSILSYTLQANCFVHCLYLNWKLKHMVQLSYNELLASISYRKYLIIHYQIIVELIVSLRGIWTQQVLHYHNVNFRK
jgi:hypothetical protein